MNSKGRLKEEDVMFKILNLASDITLLKLPEEV
jgi:hypothetical protein